MSGTRKGIKRLIWAPRILPMFPAEGLSVQVDEREPLDRLSLLGARFQEGDQVEGGSLAEFREFVVRCLQSTALRPLLGHTGSGVGLRRVYILHQECDRAFAVEIAKALRAQGAVGTLPPSDDDPRAREELHERRLAEAEIVALFWRDASRTWLEATALSLSDLILTGRAPQSRRLVVLGGDMTASKAEYLELFPPDEIDTVVDGTDADADTLADKILAIPQVEGM